MWTAQETPDLGQMPVDDRVDAHEGRPVSVGAVEVREVVAVRVGAAGADEDGADLGVGGEVEGEGVAEGDALFWQMVLGGGVLAGCGYSRI